MIAALAPDRPGLDPLRPRDALPEISADADLKDLAEAMMNSLGASGLVIAYDTAGSVICHLSLGSTAPPVGSRLEIDYGISGLCMREGKPQICADTENSPAVDREASRHLGVFSVAVVPLLHEEKVIGVIESLADRPNAFTQHSLRQLEALGNHVAHRIARGEQKESLLATPRSIDEKMELGDIAAPEVLTTSADLSDQLPGSEDSGMCVSLVSSATEAQQNSVAPNDVTAIPDYPITAESLPLSEGPSGWKVARRSALFFVIFILFALFAQFFVIAERNAGARSLATRKDSTFGASPNTTRTQPLGKDEVGTISTVTPNDTDGSADPMSGAATLQTAPPGSRTGVAQLTFGKHFESDDGGNRDLVKACTWYILALKAGNAEAQEAVRRVTSLLSPIEIAHVRYNVGKAYATGSGTAQDVVTAYLWFQLADAAGDERAKREETKLAATMPPSELERARQMAAEWIDKHQQRHFPTEQTQTLH